MRLNISSCSIALRDIHKRDYPDKRREKFLVVHVQVPKHISRYAALAVPRRCYPAQHLGAAVWTLTSCANASTVNMDSGI